MNSALAPDKNAAPFKASMGELASSWPVRYDNMGRLWRKSRLNSDELTHCSRDERSGRDNAGEPVTHRRRACPTAILATQHLFHRRANGCGRLACGDAGAAHRLHLVARGTLAPGYDGTGMAHAAAGRGGGASDEADHWLISAGGFSRS